jgi:uncharacterized lipoprotein YddW (UPF0748 family)
MTNEYFKGPVTNDQVFLLGKFGFVRQPLGVRGRSFVMGPWSLLILILCSLAVCESHAAPREFRGAWVATVYNLDWPSKPGLSAATQQAQLRTLLDRAASLHLNAILLQVRPASDALYSSSLEPWSEVLSGTAGVSPGYDPLAFAISEAHARGLELHAWVNPFRAALHRNDRLPSKHVAVEHPEWIRRFGNQLWIDPGVPAARRYVISVITDIARRYPVDGIHLDDYFYPYPVKGGGSFPDEASWRAYGKDSGLSRGDWRRRNVNEFVRDLYHGVKSARSEARFGISPFGIWRPGVPSTIKASIDSYAHLFADSRLWLANGWVDYLAPQLYWSIRPPAQSYSVLLDWWRSQSRGTPIWPGIATERIGKRRPAGEIAAQIELARNGTSSPGHIHWSMKALLRDQGGIDELLRGDLYRERADPPPR